MAEYILRPNSDVSVALTRSSGVSNYALVDEATADGDGTYVYRSGDSAADDLYGLPNPSETGTISNVRVYHRHRKESAEAVGYAAPLVKIGGVTYNGTQRTSTTSYVTHYSDWANNPNTSSAWTWTNINDLQAGVRLQGGNDGKDDYNTRCTQVYAEITYAPKRSAAVATGLADTASRDSQYDRGATDVTGQAISAIREAGFPRAAVLMSGIAAVSSLTVGYMKSAGRAIGIDAAASRATALARVITVAVGQAVGASRTLAFHTSSGVGIGSLLAGIHLGFRKLSQRSTGIIAAAGRLVDYRRDAPLLSAMQVSVRRGFYHAAQLLTELKAGAGRGWDSHRDAVLHAGLSVWASHFLGYLRDSVVAMAAFSGAGRAWQARRNVQVSEYLSVTAGRAVAAIRTVICQAATFIRSARVLFDLQELTLGIRKTLLNLPWRSLDLSMPQSKKPPALRLRRR